MHRETSVWARWSIVAAAVAFATALGGPAAAGTKYTTVFKTHLIYGTTPQAVWRYMTTHPIDDPDDGPALANITHAHRTALTTTASRGRCAVKHFTFTWRFVITLPKAVDYAKMSSSTARLWREFRAKARWHELHRRAIFLNCAASFVPAAERMTAPTCWALQAKVRRHIDEQYAVCMKKQRVFGITDGRAVAKLGLVRVGRGY